MIERTHGEDHEWQEYSRERLSLQHFPSRVTCCHCIAHSNEASGAIRIVTIAWVWTVGSAELFVVVVFEQSEGTLAGNAPIILPAG